MNLTSILGTVALWTIDHLRDDEATGGLRVDFARSPLGREKSRKYQSTAQPLTLL